MMKSLLLLSPFYNPKIGGVERHVEALCSTLSGRGYQIKVITYQHDDSLRSIEKIGAVEVLRMPQQLKSRPAIWKWLWQQRDSILKADFVHCHDFTTFWCWYLPFRFLFRNKPVYLTFHGYEGYPLDNGVIRARRISSRLVRGHICIGDYIPKWYGTPTKYISYGAVAIEPNKNCLVKTKGAVFVGRLEKDTGILDYVKTLVILKEQYNLELDLTICGNGSLRKVIEDYIAEYQLNVEFKGFVNNPEYWFRHAKVAFVSGYLAILEAMVSRCLVCSIYDNPLKEDYLTQMPCADLMTIAGSPQDMAHNLYATLQDGERLEELTLQGYDYASEQTWDKVADMYINLWSKE